MSLSMLKPGYLNLLGVIPILIHGFSRVNLFRIILLGVLESFLPQTVRLIGISCLLIVSSAIGNSLIDLLEFGGVMYYTHYHYKYCLYDSGIPLLVEIILWLLVNGVSNSQDKEISILLLLVSSYVVKECLLNHNLIANQYQENQCTEEIKNLKNELKHLQKQVHNTTFIETQGFRKRIKDLLQKLKNSMNSKDTDSGMPGPEGSGDFSCEFDSIHLKEEKKSFSDSFKQASSLVKSFDESFDESQSQKLTPGGYINLVEVSKSDLSYMINCVMFREYLIFSHRNSNINDFLYLDNEIIFSHQNSDMNDFLDLDGEIMKTYTQAIRLSSGSQKLFKKTLRTKRMRSMMEINDQLVDILEDVGEWDFDTLAMSTYSHNPCFEVGYYVFITLGLTELFDISNKKLRNFLTTVEKEYNHENYYHNSFHAADVASSTVFLIINGIGFCGNLPEIDIFALVVAALCHDIGHPGVNNAFLISQEDELALVYNDKSVLENMHVFRTFQILKNKSCNIHSKISEADAKIFRKIVIETILATDLSLHFTRIKQIREGLEEGKTLEDESFKMLALQLTLKCADLGHGAKKLEIHKEWTELITKEFFKQGDTERELGMTVGIMFDREKVIVSHSQIGFLNFLVKPLFDVYEELVINFSEERDEELKIEICSKNIIENLNYWEQESTLSSASI